jgi:hypothetical protein
MRQEKTLYRPTSVADTPSETAKPNSGSRAPDHQIFLRGPGAF